jgi:hypothetical protein
MILRLVTFAAALSAVGCISSEIQRESSFFKTPKDVTARLGTTIVLPCSIENPLGNVQWTLNGFGLGDDRPLANWDRYSMVGTDRRRK